MSDTITHKDKSYNEILQELASYFKKDSRKLVKYLRETHRESDRQIVEGAGLDYSVQTLSQKYPRKETK